MPAVAGLNLILITRTHQAMR